MRKKMLLIVGGVFLLLFNISGAVISVSQNPEIIEQEQSIVFLEEPTLLPENEGKIVAISGTLEELTGAYDDMLDIQFPYAVVKRQEYRYDYQHDDVKDRYEAEWSKSNYTMLFGTAKVGEFNISTDLLYRLSSECVKVPKSAYDQATLDNLYVTEILSDRAFSRTKVPKYSDWSDYWQGGYKAYGFSSYQGDGEILSFVGYQKGDTLERSMVKTSFMQGTLTPENYEYTEESDGIKAAIFYGVLALIGAGLVFAGIKIDRDSRNCERCL